MRWLAWCPAVLYLLLVACWQCQAQQCESGVCEGIPIEVPKEPNEPPPPPPPPPPNTTEASNQDAPTNEHGVGSPVPGEKDSADSNKENDKDALSTRQSDNNDVGTDREQLGQDNDANSSQKVQREASNLNDDSPVADEKPEPLECGMYMAESSIPNSGWGMYTTKEIAKGDIIHPTDPVIQVADIKKQMRLRAQHDTKLPLWLLDEYYWNSETTGGYYDARNVKSIVPGFGMLANSHTGLVNAREKGPQYKMMVDRNVPEAGAYTQYKDATFRAGRNIPAGHEIMVEYGDSWFEQRTQHLGDGIPLSHDFKAADRLLTQLDKWCDGDLDTNFCQDFWQLIRDELTSFASPRLINALPSTLEQVKEVRVTGTAYHSVPNVIRPLEWLQENGMCLDHIQPLESTIPRAGTGAFATRNLPKGTIVAPAPVVHLHRGHMDIFFDDKYDKKQTLWKGHQLLLNYLYGHPSTSLVFFPYSPVVNLINHSPEPNVELRWSSRMAHPEWLNLTVDELVTDSYGAGLMMEIVALRDIRDGQEIVLDYGRDWDAAWEKHLKEWREPLNTDIHRPIEVIKGSHILPTQSDDDQEPLPPNAMTVCWVDLEETEEGDYQDEVIWLSSTATKDLSETYQCNLLARDSSGRKDRYTAQVDIDGTMYRVKGMLRRAIEVVDRPYSANQFLRQAFRHEIQLPDDMIPEAWKDRKVVEESCQLYLAESAVPNSGLGMFTAKEIKDSQDFSYPEIVIHAEDPNENRKLRLRADGKKKNAESEWIVEHYFWNSGFAAGKFEAFNVQSIVPGAGMLANSHTGVYNVATIRPQLDSAGLDRKRDPGAGASTTFHGMRFVATNGDIPAGMELYMEYGDRWFEEHEDVLGLIPLSEDYAEADVMLLEFWDVIGGNPDSEMAHDLWELLWNTTDESRVLNALPRDLKDIEGVLDTGTALYSVRNSIRSKEWLEENGRCLDNIKAGVSNIPQAGHGAFATRHIAKGQIVAPAPLIQLTHDQMRVLDTADMDNLNGEIWEEGEQLLKNYCYGHANSTLLLFPYSPIVNYINHDQENFNTKLQWSKLPNHRSDLLNRSVDELLSEDHAGLVMEFVSTRDIAPGEEILVDYGPEWQRAWERHVKEWKPPKKDYVPPWVLNDFTRPVRTLDEQREDPYPPNVMMKCYVGNYDKTQPGQLVNGKLEYKWEYFNGMYDRAKMVFDCEVLSRHGDYISTADSIRPVNEKYKIRVWRRKEMAWMVSNVPRRAIEFFDRPYESDLTLRSAFRHEIALPDHMWPTAWLDNVQGR